MEKDIGKRAQYKNPDIINGKHWEWETSEHNKILQGKGCARNNYFENPGSKITKVKSIGV